MLDSVLDLPIVLVDDTLMCPSCEGEYLHQERVEIGWRSEDKDVTHHISKRKSVEVSIIPAENVASPNGYGYRRDYIIIHFSCENCDSPLELEIRQHKGQTVFSWVKID